MKSKVRYEFSQRLQHMVGKELKIRINDNRSTMLHVRWKPNGTSVSVHRMFVKAPQAIQQALASYIRREHKVLAPAVKAYIDKNSKALDYTYLLSPEQIDTDGKVYNLQGLLSKLNRRYFDGKLQLKISWFGESDAKSRSKCTLGLYYDNVKLIKIHRLLDCRSVPSYVIEYVIYHEMVHAVCPAYVDQNGRNCIHGKEFKALERQYEAFFEADTWIKGNLKNFFVDQRIKSNGRTQQMGEYQASKRQSGRRKRQNIYSHL